MVNQILNNMFLMFFSETSSQFLLDPGKKTSDSENPPLEPRELACHGRRCSK